MPNMPSTESRQVRILQAALRCFNARGVEATAIDEIRAESGASIGSIYHHFESKLGLAAALLVGGLRSNIDELKPRLAQARGAQAGVRAIVQSLIAWIVANPDWARFVYNVSEISVRDHASSQLQAVNEEYMNLLHGYFGPDIQAGVLRRLPLAVYPALVVGPVHDYARRWLNGHATPALAELESVFVDAAWQAVRKQPAKGRGK